MADHGTKSNKNTRNTIAERRQSMEAKSSPRQPGLEIASGNDIATKDTLRPITRESGFGQCYFLPSLNLFIFKSLPLRPPTHTHTRQIHDMLKYEYVVCKHILLLLLLRFSIHSTNDHGTISKNPKNPKRKHLFIIFSISRRKEKREK